MFKHSTHIRWALTVALAAAAQGAVPPSAAAQTDTLAASSVGSGRLRFVVGHRWLDLTELNERLAGAGLSTFESGFGSIGGRLLGGGGRLLTGVEGHLLLGAAPPAGGQPSFDDVIADPGQQARLESSGFLADMSLTMEYRFGEGKGLVVGLGVGYTLAMGRWDWRVDGVQGVTFGPDAAVGGFHVDVSLGGWGKSEG